MQNTCEIVPVGKRRNGGTKYWCIRHKADATAKYGKPNNKCRYAHIPPIQENERLRLEVDEYRGGVAIWGAVPALYDTTQLPMERGIHVHARKNETSPKIIDGSYRSVILIVDGNQFEISELDAIYFMVSTVYGMTMKYVECNYCNWPHLDKDWFSVHPHKRHLCSGCGRNFTDTEINIGNPVSELCKFLNCPPRKTPKRSIKNLAIKQSDYSGGIQIWGSNPAILWTGGQHEEEGIHVHVYDEYGKTRVVDDTFGSVTIDNISLDSHMVRYLMAQNCLPHLKPRVVTVTCNFCGNSHFDVGDSAFKPSIVKRCKYCEKEIRTNTRLKKVVSNPLVEIFKRLEMKSVNIRQYHDLGLLPETI